MLSIVVTARSSEENEVAVEVETLEVDVAAAYVVLGENESALQEEGKDRGSTHVESEVGVESLVLNW